MTNHWADIANSTNVVVWGANPAENHPACIAHINRARFPKQYFASGDPRAAKKAAKMIVIDPRKTRTAQMVDETIGDRYVRIRPGSDIAFGNGLMRYMIAKVESLGAADPIRVAFFAYLNQNGAGTFYTDGSATTASVGTANGTSAAQGAGLANGNSKYTDARFLVNTAGTDYQRAQITASTGVINSTPLPADNTTIANFPLKAALVTDDPNTVYNRLKAHVDPYTLTVTADICGCTEADIQVVGDAFIENSRCSSGASTDPRSSAYRATTMLYAMGITQHTCGGQNVKMFAQVQTLMGNMGRCGGGINALRGIHNVQGSTDMGLLYGNIPGYSANPGTQVAAIPDTGNNFGKYVDALWGTPVSGTGNKATMNGSYDDAYNTAALSLQQRGFLNMTLKWFGDYAGTLPGTAADRTKTDAAFSLWPKGQGSDHITMFREMAGATPTTKALVSWGQNPAVTEPNQGAIRAGLENLDLLVVVDLFANETACCSRKAGSTTYLIPTAAHTEKAGSATNSGRTLQWRYQAAAPAGNSKDDNELLLRFAKALDDNVTGGSAFSHIYNVWNTYSFFTYSPGSPAPAGAVWQRLYRDTYAPTYSGTTGFAALSGSAEIWPVRPNVNDTSVVPVVPTTVTGSEWVAEMLYREVMTASASGGTVWIYTNGYAAGRVSNKHWNQADWGTANRAKSRDRSDPNGTLASPGWGYAWLVNRRVLYNNNADNPGTATIAGTSTSECPGDVNDLFMGPDSASRLFVSTNTAVLNYSRWYRTIHRLADKPTPVLAAATSSPHYAGSPVGAASLVSLAGRFAAHTEPYETPRQDLLANTLWGRNTKNTGAWDLVKTDTRVAGRGSVSPVVDPPVSSFPLVLTTIRCVEHFQGGPITRNNWFNVELEPEPWIEINSTDARAAGITDGQMVRVVTARIVNDSGATVLPPNYGSGFRARVGSGLSASQKVGPGVVAIPWHWGEKGLSTGSRANDLCIDAGDANTVIPESKACLCRIEKI
jgi:anaerobic selenocysteine-containing dehydrogenase